MLLASIRMRITLAFFLTLALFAPDSSTNAQARRPAIGIGFSTLATTGQNPVGLGFDTRLSWSLNVDFSVAAGASLVGYIFDGRDEAAYFLLPQASAIVKLDAFNVRAPYVLAGLGGYLPVSGDDRKDESGPTVHGGIGWMIALEATAVYIEVNPTLVVARKAADFLLPLRFGVIL